MYRKTLGIFIAFLALYSFALHAQGTRDLRINEVLVVNETNFQDDYGVHSAWIEIFNTSYASVNIGGCYLTNDKENPTKYPIPKGDVLTLIKPRQHVLFWADGIPSRGTFHVSFRLNPEKDNYIALYDSNGKTLIDEVVIPAGQIADHSWARAEDGSPVWERKGGSNESYVTPKTSNVTQDKNVKMERFIEQDPRGLGMTVTAMMVVFIGLILLYLCFKLVGIISVRMSKRNAMKAQGIESKEEAKGQRLGSRSGEEIAAISMALHEYLNDAHDFEDMIITINKVKRTYSPWSSKIYTLRRDPKQ